MDFAYPKDFSIRIGFDWFFSSFRQWSIFEVTTKIATRIDIEMRNFIEVIYWKLFSLLFSPHNHDKSYEKRQTQATAVVSLWMRTRCLARSFAVMFDFLGELSSKAFIQNKTLPWNVCYKNEWKAGKKKTWEKILLKSTRKSIWIDHCQ